MGDHYKPGAIKHLNAQQLLENQQHPPVAAAGLTSGTAMLITDSLGLIQSWNKLAAARYGYTEEEAVGRNILFLFSETTIQSLNSTQKPEVLLASGILKGKQVHITKAGQTFTADVFYNALYDYNQQLTAYQIHLMPPDGGDAATPAPLQKQGPAQHRPNQKDDSFRKFIESCYSGISLLDPDFNVIYRNPSAAGILGWTTGSSLGINSYRLIYPADRDMMAGQLANVLQNPGVPITCRFRARHALGHYLWLECMFTNLLNEADVNGIVANFRDLSQQIDTESRLQESANELLAYKYALDESAMVSITDHHGIIRHVNDNFCAISQYSRQELLGQNHRIINSAYHDAAFFSCLWSTIASGRVWKGELRNKAKDGTFYWVDTTIVPFLNEKGRPYQYAAIRSDITERKRGEELLAGKAQFIQTVTDHLPAMIAYYSADLLCLFANKPYQDYFGKQVSQVIGSHKRDLMGPAEFSAHELHLQGVLDGIIQKFERTFTKDNGHAVYTHTQYLPDQDGDAVKGFYSLIYDVTDVKKAETELIDKAKQIEDLLENINDGFIAIDFDLNFTYANKRMGQLVGMDPRFIVGKHILALFPEAEGSVTFLAIQKAMRQREYICNEDYYAPLDLWQENRIYPSLSGVSVFIRDISERKRADDQIRQFNERFALISKATNDALFEWNLETNEVWWSETHFTMFGFDPQGPVPSQQEWLLCLHPDARQAILDLDQRILKKSVDHWQQEVVYLRPNKTWGTLLNRGFVVLNAQQQPARMLGSFMDITDRKNDERQKEIMAHISQLFNEPASLTQILHQVLEKVLEYSGASVTEIWLTTGDQSRVMLAAKKAKCPNKQVFFEESADVKSLARGEGLPGRTLAAGISQFWRYADSEAAFVRRGPAESAGLKSAFSIPLFYNNDVVGVLIQRFDTDDRLLNIQPGLFDAFNKHLGTEIKNHQLVQQLQQVFDCAPDMICITGIDRFFKKVNPAMSTLLEYTPEELLGLPIDTFMHPDDLEKSKERMKAFIDGAQTIYFDNRYISKSGKVIWLSWTASKAAEEGLLFCVAKDVSDKKDLQNMLDKANQLARIGGWEIDLRSNKVYWSPITREIHEVGADFEPDAQNAISFYRDDDHRQQITEKVNEAINSGKPCDAELQIITAKGNMKWVRVIIEAEYNNEHICIRLRGSFQDIDDRKTAEMTALTALNEKNLILDSIGDGFFALDRDWMITYWNSTAEKTMGRPRESMLGKNFWDMYADVKELESFRQYHVAMETGKAVHFEDYYPPMDTWFGVNAYPSENGLSVFFKDITERKRTLWALEESEKRYSDLFQLSPQPMWVYEMATLRFLDVNMAAVKHYGYTREEFLSITIRDIRPAEDVAQLEKAVAENLHHQKVKLHDIFRHRKKNGEIIKVAIQSNIITYRGVPAKVVLASDITERENYVKAIEIQNQKLREISWIQSHVIRAPLARILGLVPLINILKADDEEQKLIYGYILQSARELDEVIRTITDVTSIVKIE